MDDIRAVCEIPLEGAEETREGPANGDALTAL